MASKFETKNYKIFSRDLESLELLAYDDTRVGTLWLRNQTAAVGEGGVAAVAGAAVGEL